MIKMTNEMWRIVKNEFRKHGFPLRNVGVAICKTIRRCNNPEDHS